MTNVYLVKTGFFSSYIWMTWESWPIKKAEHQRIDAFKLWFWRRLLRVPWTARSNQSVLKEINAEYSLERLMLKQDPVLWPPDTKSWLIGKDPDAGKHWRQRRRGQRIRLDGIIDSMDIIWSKLWEKVKEREAVDGVAKRQTWLTDWTTAATIKILTWSYRHRIR